MGYTKLELAYLEEIRRRLKELRAFINTLDLTESTDVRDWYTSLARLRAIQGNVSNDLSFVACLLAKRYLQEHFAITDFDAAAKAQGASGLDIDVYSPNGERIVAEIKTTVPYSGAKNDLGAQQKTSFRKDFAKLNAAQATHKLLFVTDKSTFEVVQRRYLSEIPGVQVVLLDLGAV